MSPASRLILLPACLCAMLTLSYAQDAQQALKPPADEEATQPSGSALHSSRAKEGSARAASIPSASESVCLMVEGTAREYGLPVEFFARVIWQESRFRADAVGPVTRSGERARGIAQFMPGTAIERGLLNPFDPVQALPKSAEYLRELRDEFGNLGLAAAAYNAGPRRVREWLAGTGPMPAETRSYVASITGASVDEWRSARRELWPSERNKLGCRELIALLRRAPNVFVDQLEQRVKLVALRPWGVQLSAGFSRDRALAIFGALTRRRSAILAGHDPSILASTLRSRGTRPFYQVRIGSDTRSGAEELCGRLRMAGEACMVLRNSSGRAQSPPLHQLGIPATIRPVGKT